MKSQSPSTARRQGTHQTDAAHAEQPPHNALPRAAAAPPPRAAAAHTCSPRVSYVLSLRALQWSTASEDVLSGPITLLNHAQPDRCPTTADRRIGTARLTAPTGPDLAASARVSLSITWRKSAVWIAAASTNAESGRAAAAANSSRPSEPPVPVRAQVSPIRDAATRQAARQSRGQFSLVYVSTPRANCALVVSTTARECLARANRLRVLAASVSRSIPQKLVPKLACTPSSTGFSVRSAEI